MSKEGTYISMGSGLNSSISMGSGLNSRL